MPPSASSPFLVRDAGASLSALPAALPSLFGGFRVGRGGGVSCVVASPRAWAANCSAVPPTPSNPASFLAASAVRPFARRR